MCIRDSNDSTVSPETSLNHITSSPVPTPSHQQKVEALKAKGFRFSVDHLTPDQFSQLVDVLHDFRQAFATELHEMPGLKDYQYDITACTVVQAVACTVVQAVV